MAANHIPLIMQRLDKIVTEDRIRKYSTALIVKIIVILKIYGVSYRSSKYFFNNHKEFMELLSIQDIPNFRTLFYRSLRIDWHYCKRRLIFVHFRRNKIDPYRQYNFDPCVIQNSGQNCMVLRCGE